VAFGGLEHNADAVDQIAHGHEEALHDDGVGRSDDIRRRRFPRAPRASRERPRTNPASAGPRSSHGKGADVLDRRRSELNVYI
jgi:hypothetical protein